MKKSQTPKPTPVTHVIKDGVPVPKKIVVDSYEHIKAKSQSLTAAEMRDKLKKLVSMQVTWLESQASDHLQPFEFEMLGKALTYVRVLEADEPTPDFSKMSDAQIEAWEKTHKGG